VGLHTVGIRRRVRVTAVDMAVIMLLRATADRVRATVVAEEATTARPVAVADTPAVVGEEATPVAEVVVGIRAEAVVDTQVAVGTVATANRKQAP